MVDVWEHLRDLEQAAKNTSGYIKRDGFRNPVYGRMAAGFISVSDKARDEIVPGTKEASEFVAQLEAAWENFALGMSGADEDRLWSLLNTLQHELYEQMLDAQQIAAATKGYLLQLRSEDITWSPWLPAVGDLPERPEYPQPEKGWLPAGAIETAVVVGVGALIVSALVRGW